MTDKDLHEMLSTRALALGVPMFDQRVVDLTILHIIRQSRFATYDIARRRIAAYYAAYTRR